MAGATSGAGGSVAGGTGGAAIAGSTAGGAAGNAGTGGAATGGTGDMGGEGGEAMGGEGGEPGGTGGGGMAGVGGAGAGGGGAGGKAGGGAGGAGAGGGGAGGAGAGGKAGGGAGGAGAGGKAGGAGAGGGGAGGAGAGGKAGGGAGGTTGGAGASGGGSGGSGGATSMAPNLFFSEYVEGNNVADAFEVYNASGAAVNLAGCEVRVSYAGAGSSAVTLTGTLAAGDVFVLCLGNISFACDSTVGALSDLSGDDSVVLACNNVTLDVIGQVGIDPGVEWGTGMTGTQNQTLRRMCNVTIGERNPTNPFNPADEWVGRAVDNISGLGGRLCPCTAANQNICP